MPGVIRTYLLPQLIDPAELAGGIAIVIDQLRASTTICAALVAGAAGVRPFLKPQDAIQYRESFGQAVSSEPIVLGGERGGVLIPGFDLANSPRQYTPVRIGGKRLYFTTTNGTRAIEHASRAGAAVFIGCLGNLSAIVDHVAGSEQAIHLICAGTGGLLTLDDALAAGAIAVRVADRGHPLADPDQQRADDSSLLAIQLWHGAVAQPGGVLHALLASCGGRDLCRIGLREDVVDCACIDAYPIVPWLNSIGDLVEVAKK